MRSGGTMRRSLATTILCLGYYVFSAAAEDPSPSDPTAWAAKVEDTYGKQDVYVPSEHGDGGFVEGKVKHKVGKIVFETCDPRKHSRIQCSVGVNRMMGVKEFFYSDLQTFDNFDHEGGLVAPTIVKNGGLPRFLTYDLDGKYRESLVVDGWSRQRGT